MSRYLSGVLRGLERIYEFRSAQRGAPEEVELDLPIQVVQDVSALAEYGTGQGQNRGWWLLSSTNVHVIVGTLEQTRSIRTPTFAVNGYEAGWDPDVRMAWIYDAIAGVDSGTNFQFAMVLMIQAASAIGPTGAIGPNVNTLLMRWDDHANLGAGGATLIIGGEPPRNMGTFPIPILEKNDGSAASIIYNSTADNAGVLNCSFMNRFWIGSKFAHPPICG